MFTFLPKIGLAPSRSQQVRLHQVNKAKLESTSQQLLPRGTFPRQSSDSPVFRPRLDRAFYSFVIVLRQTWSMVSLKTIILSCRQTPIKQLRLYPNSNNYYQNRFNASTAFPFSNVSFLFHGILMVSCKFIPMVFYIYLLLWVYLQTRSLARDNQIG